MQLLSRRYQGDDGPPIPMPSFTKRSFPDADGVLLEAYSPLMPHLVHTAVTVELGQRYATLNRDTDGVAFKITKSQLCKIRDRVVQRGALDVHPSLQDCLTAYIIYTINRYIDVAVTKLTNAASVRSP